MFEYNYITLRQKPELKEQSALWFSEKWNVPMSAYLQCMNDYLNCDTEYGWYLCLDNHKIVGGLGVIENDFHQRKDLTPNICAVYVDKDYRCQGIAGKLLKFAINDLKEQDISSVYLVTNHTNFYERYGFEFLCDVHCDDGELSRMYVYKEKNPF